MIDLIFVMFVFAAVITAGLMANTVLNAFMSDPTIQTSLNATNFTAGASINRVATHTTQTDGGGMDNTITVFFFLIHIAILVLAALIPTNVIFLIITIMFVLINITMSYIAQSISAPLFAGFAVSLPMSKWLLDHLIAIELGYSVMLVVVMFMAARAMGASGGGTA